MRKLIPLLLVLAFGFACKTSKPPKAPPPGPAATPVDAATLTDAVGTSVETAVAVPASAASDEGILFENRWIYDRYGKFRRRFSGIVSEAGRHYDEITVELFDHSERVVYFDITEVYGATVPATTR
jgi:hypothetical protein